MFDVNFAELGVIGVVALIVIGPEQLPRVARTAGHVMGRLRRYVADVKSDISREMEMADLQRIHEEVQSSVRSVESSIREHVAGFEAEVQQTVASASAEIHQLADTAIAEVSADHPESRAAESYLHIDSPSIPPAGTSAGVPLETSAEIPIEVPVEVVVDPNQMDMFGAPAAVPTTSPERH